MDTQILLWGGLTFIAFLALLIKASDYFTEAAEDLGLALGISPLLIGLSIVALGTSLPELVTSIIATMDGRSAIVAGNVIGSNITNVLLVFGMVIITANIAKVKVQLIDKRFFGLSAILVSLVVLGGVITFWQGIICLAFLVSYLVYYAFFHSADCHPDKSKHQKFKISSLIMLLVTPILIHLGAKWLIESVVVIAAELNIGEEIIATTAIALGTSLPELCVSIVAARRGAPEIAIGNIIGSNVLNSSLVLGVSAMISPVIIKPSILYIGLPFMWLSTILLVLIIQKDKIPRYWGVILLFLYLAFVITFFVS